MELPFRVAATWRDEVANSLQSLIRPRHSQAMQYQDATNRKQEPSEPLGRANGALSYGGTSGTTQEHGKRTRVRYLLLLKSLGNEFSARFVENEGVDQAELQSKCN